MSELSKQQREALSRLYPVFDVEAFRRASSVAEVAPNIVITAELILRKQAAPTPTEPLMSSTVRSPGVEMGQFPALRELIRRYYALVRT